MTWLRIASASAKHALVARRSQGRGVVKGAGEPGLLFGLLPFRERRTRKFNLANLLQYGQVNLHQFLHDWRRDILVTVAQYIADPRHFVPRNFWMTGFQLIAEMPACLGNNQDAALDQPLLLPIDLERVERRIAQHRVDTLDRLNNVR